MNSLKTRFVGVCLLFISRSFAQSAIGIRGVTIKSIESAFISEQFDTLSYNNDSDLRLYWPSFPVGILNFDSYSVCISDFPAEHLEHVFFPL